MGCWATLWPILLLLVGLLDSAASGSARLPSNVTDLFKPKPFQLSSCYAPLLIQGKAKDISSAVRHYWKYTQCIIIATETVTPSELFPATPSVVLVPTVNFQDKARVNKQVLSTVMGLERAAGIGAKFVFKVRADLHIHGFDVLLTKLISLGLPSFMAIWRLNHHEMNNCVRDVPMDYYQFGELQMMRTWWRSIGLEEHQTRTTEGLGEYILEDALMRVYRGPVFFMWPFMLANNLTAYSVKYKVDYVQVVADKLCTLPQQKRCYCLPGANQTPDCCNGARMRCRGSRRPYFNCKLLDYVA
mmetsp:Transcript_66259/g.117661  ORF Transcript_66259/g.117661 Transcript_66259/m.117661 type:complete len:301 (-) Transcript_66259:1320-2222(-)